MRTANPALSDKTFGSAVQYRGAADDRMTIRGAVNKTAILTVLLFAAAFWSWDRFQTNPDSAMLLALLGLAVGFVLSLVIIFKQTTAPFLSPVYALAEGITVGAISAAYESQFDGIVFQALGLTAMTLFALLAAYRSGLIPVTENFRLGVVAATGAIALMYLVSFAMRLFGTEMPYLHDNGVVGIGISVVIVIVAALNLVLDFDFIEKGAASGAPKHMEWYAAFGLLVTLVWLYLEILRLLAKLRSRD
ncbi:MAG: putative rane protein [Thermoleophilia bacterium]|nr:putative rane protein [Thermoleophilia bacterium]